MNRFAATFWDLLRGDAEGGRVVPPSGLSAWLVITTSAAMGFVAVLALVLAMTAERVAADWRSALALSATIVIDATGDDAAAAEAAVREILDTTAGVDGVRALDPEEQRALLTPWFGAGLDAYDLPRMLALELSPDFAPDGARNLALRLEAEVPEAVLDDHGAWRAPLIATAGRVETTGRLVLIVVLGALTCVIGLSSQAAIAANKRNIGTLRLIGASDRFIARAFVRRITLRSVLGAALGTFCGSAVAVFIFGNGSLPPLTTFDWVKCLGLVPLVGLISFVATRIAVTTSLRRIT